MGAQLACTWCDEPIKPDDMQSADGKMHAACEAQMRAEEEE